MAVAVDPGTRVAPDAPSRPRYDPWWWAMVLGAGVWRVLYVIVAKPDQPLLGDQIYYSGQARMIALGRWFEHPHRIGEYAADHAPLTALVLAPVSVTDDPVMAQRLAMAVIGTLVVAAIGAFTWRLAGRRAGLAATALAAVSANLWMNDALVMSETLAAAGVVAVLWCSYAARERPVWWLLVLTGVATGLAGLARAELLVLLPAVVVPMVLASQAWGPRGASASDASDASDHGHRWRRWGAVAVVVAATVATLAPWLIRNAVRFEERTLISTQDGLTLYGANCPATYFGSGIGFWSLQCALEVPMPDGADQSQVSSIYRELAVDYVRANLDRTPRVVVARLARGLSLWGVDGMAVLNQGEGRERRASHLGAVQFWLLVPLAGLAIVQWRRVVPGHPRWPLVVTGALSVLVIAAFYGIPRFRIPMEVSMLIAGGIGIELLARTRPWRAVMPPTASGPGSTPPR